MKKRGIEAAIIIVAILLAIAGVWLLKNSNTTRNRENSPQSISVNPDFKFEIADELDMGKLKTYGLPIIIDFGSDECVPCKEIYPVIKELNEALMGKAIIRYVDTGKYKAIAEEFPIRVLPTQIFIASDGGAFISNNPIFTQKMVFSMRSFMEHEFTIHEGAMTREQMQDILKEMGITL